MKRGGPLKRRTRLAIPCHSPIRPYLREAPSELIIRHHDEMVTVTVTIFDHGMHSESVTLTAEAFAEAVATGLGVIARMP